MKRFVSVILTVALLLSVIPWKSICVSVSAATSDFAGGKGTESDPYRIATKEHLNNVRSYLSAHFKMVADIELTDDDYSRDGIFYGYGERFVPIGYGRTFTGTFDGDGHVIRNLQMKSTSEKPAGLFSENGGTIKNVGIVDSDLSATNDLGSIAGANYGTIENCYQKGSVMGEFNIGGITGINGYNGIVKNCYNIGPVTARETYTDSNAGGIVGYNYSGGTIENCYNKGSVSAGPGSSSKYYSDGCVGGIVGYTYKGTVKSCYNTGSVKATGAGTSFYVSVYAYAGGIAGRNESGTIQNCYNTGSASASSRGPEACAYTGGIAGDNGSSTIENCYNIGTASAEAIASYGELSREGGITGYGGTVNNSYTGNTVEELKSQATYVGFDFDSVWTMAGDPCYPYAELKNVTVSSGHFYCGLCDTTCDCGTVRTSYASHTSATVYDDVNHTEKCTVCIEVLKTELHRFDNDCDTACDCGYRRTIRHSYDNTCDTLCNVCGQERTITHTYDDVCDTDCNVCGDIRTVPHVYDDTCDAECNVCKGIRQITHTYDNVCDWECNICKHVRSVPEHSYTLNGTHTCDICKYSKTPNKPTVESKTNSSVTLVQTEGLEYSADGEKWQSSNVFANLSPDTTYTFYQRVKASLVALVSLASEGTAVTFKSYQAAPSAPIISSFTDTAVTLVTTENAEYSADGETWQTSPVFTELSPGTQYTFYQRYAETDTYEASNSSTGRRVTTDKSKQTLIPDAPTVKSVTASSITLMPVEGCEYSLDGTSWKSGTTFYSLSCGTEYTFYQRYKETASTYAGKSSDVLVAKTDKGTQSRPDAPELRRKTHNTVTLYERIGYEYSRDGIHWQTSPEFTGLDAETNYMFYQRKAETQTYYASEASTSLTVKTDEQPPIIRGDMDSDDQVADADALYLLRHTLFPARYPLQQSGDVNGDSVVTDADALYLLRHTLFPERYPLKG